VTPEEFASSLESFGMSEEGEELEDEDEDEDEETT
jgi:hypothetical protein